MLCRVYGAQGLGFGGLPFRAWRVRGWGRGLRFRVACLGVLGLRAGVSLGARGDHVTRGISCSNFKPDRRVSGYEL